MVGVESHGTILFDRRTSRFSGSTYCVASIVSTTGQEGRIVRARDGNRVRNANKAKVALSWRRSGKSLTAGFSAVFPLKAYR